MQEEKKNTSSHIESENVKYIEAEGRMVLIQGEEVGEMGKY